MRKSIIGALLAMPTLVWAGPFGLNQGDSYESLSKRLPLTKQKNPLIYSTPKAPAGHPEIEDYWLTIGSTAGLCRVTAWTPEASSSSAGYEVRASMEKWVEALTSKYGAGTKLDFLQAGSIWKDHADWMMALYKKERTLVHYWKDMPANPDNIKTIMVEPFAFGSSKYAMKISYEYSNFENCQKEGKSMNTQNL